MEAVLHLSELLVCSSETACGDQGRECRVFALGDLHTIIYDIVQIQILQAAALTVYLPY